MLGTDKQRQLQIDRQGGHRFTGKLSGRQRFRLIQQTDKVKLADF